MCQCQGQLSISSFFKKWLFQATSVFQKHVLFFYLYKLCLYSVVFWLGDLNYQIDIYLETVKYLVRQNMMHKLKENDQVIIVLYFYAPVLIDGDMWFLFFSFDCLSFRVC